MPLSLSPIDLALAGVEAGADLQIPSAASRRGSRRRSGRRGPGRRRSPGTRRPRCRSRGRGSASSSRRTMAWCCSSRSRHARSPSAAAVAVDVDDVGEQDRRQHPVGLAACAGRRSGTPRSRRASRRCRRPTAGGRRPAARRTGRPGCAAAIQRPSSTLASRSPVRCRTSVGTRIAGSTCADVDLRVHAQQRERRAGAGACAGRTPTTGAKARVVRAARRTRPVHLGPPQSRSTTVENPARALPGSAPTG